MFGLLRDLIENTGAQVVGHSIGAAEAVDEIDKTAPDVVVVDIALAEGNGFDVLKATVDRESRPLLFMLSNHATPPYRARASRLGADAYLAKDKEISELLKSLSTLVDARAAGVVAPASSNSLI